MKDLDQVLSFLHYHGSASRREMTEALNFKIRETQVKTLLADAVAKGYLAVEGKGRATRYLLTPKAQLLRTVDLDAYYDVPMDQRQVQTGYNFELIRDVLPKVSIFTEDERLFLEKCVTTFQQRIADYPKELYEKEMERLGIDLSWKSAEIEGNTYSLLETVNLLKEQIVATGKTREETIMLLNHKMALKAIVERPQAFQRLSLACIEDIHSILIQGLDVSRSLRHTRVGILGTNYRPLAIESQIREAIQDMCELVNGKQNPYEKALLLLLLVAYIQPFTDGNKRTSRLIANALLIAEGCCPISFRTVEANDYRAALLLFYEQNNLSEFKKIFLNQVAFAMKEYF